MNRTVYDNFKKLSENEKAELNHKFRDSPVGLRLLRFLDSGISRSFKTTDAVSFIYNDDVSYSVLENRYFKLRKKILNELQQSGSSGSAGLLTAEEQVLYQCRSSDSAENRENVYKQLSALEKVCWEKNIFELLPAVIDQLIFWNQSFNRTEKNKPFYLRLEKAIALQYDMMRFNLLARKIYEINYRKGIRHAKKELAAMKDISVRHKAYPRFLMCYHHVSLYYKLGSRDYLAEPQVVGHHLSEFKKLYAKYPEMPLISYKANYIKVQHFHFANISMFYHFNRCEFQEAYDAMKETWEMVFDKDSIFKSYKTESLFYNMFTSQCMAGYYKEANETCEKYMTFLRENNQFHKLSLAYTQKARIYADIYPQTFNMNPAFLLEQVESYIRSLKKSDNVQASLDETLVLKTKMLIIAGEYDKAMKVLKESVVIKFLDGLNARELMESLINILRKKTGIKIPLADLLKRAEMLHHKAATPGEYMVLNWIIRFVRHYQQVHPA